MKKTTEATKDQALKPTTVTATEPKAAKAKKATPAPATEQTAPSLVGDRHGLPRRFSNSQIFAARPCNPLWQRLSFRPF